MTDTASPLAWGILGAGRIAHTFARNLAQSSSGYLAGVASRQLEKAEQFASEFAQEGKAKATAYGSYEALLADPTINAVYIGTPHTLHAEWSIRAARAGKHILCEKPVGLNYPEAMAVAEAVRENKVFFMEAFMYRAHPQTARIVEIIRSGVLGEIRLVQASFAFNSSFSPESRLYQQELGGGGILDVGCYPMSMVRLVAGAAVGLPFAEPTELRALGSLHPESGVDVRATALLSFKSGILAQISTGIDGAHENSLRIHGSAGTLFVPTPWLPQQQTYLTLVVGGKEERIEIATEAPLYSFEIDAVAAHTAEGEAPAMPIADTLGNMAALDQWRKAIGVIYQSEQPTALRPALPPLRAAAEVPSAQLQRRLPGLDKPISRMVMGTDLGGAIIPAPQLFALLDYFVEHGGNCIDTAYIYGGGMGDTLLGQWLRQRNVREQMVVIAKGGHTPFCTPEGMASQLHESLERLQTDYADIYMLHRDNLEIPAGEFVEALNEQKRAGRIRLFGGSNWSKARVIEANTYARERGLQGFSVLSNQFSLAEMCSPVWGGCVSCSGPEWREWLTQEQMAVFAWSSQARGFFVRGARDFTSDAEFVRCWYSDANFARLARVQELACKRNVTPMQIVAAYVLQQQFPVFALVGPQKLSEMAACFSSFSIELTREEMAWLNLEANLES